MIKRITIEDKKENIFFDKCDITLENSKGKIYKNVILVGQNGAYKTKLLKAIFSKVIPFNTTDVMQLKLRHELERDELCAQFSNFIKIELDNPTKKIAPSFIECKFDSTFPNKDKNKILDSKTMENFEILYDEKADNRFADRTATANAVPYNHSSYLLYKLYEKIGSNAVDEAYKNENFTNCIDVKRETFTKITDEINNFAKYIYIDYKNLFEGKDIILNKKLSDNETKQFNISKLSSGESQIVGIFARIGEEIIANEKNVVLCIDEPETNLHPSWQSGIIKAISKLASDIVDTYQIFSATHSGYIVQNLIDDEDTLLLSIIYNENSKKFSLEKLNTNNSFLLKPIFLCEINYVIFGISSFEYFVLLYEHLFHILKDAALVSDYKSLDCYLNKEFGIPIDVQKKLLLGKLL